MCHQAQRKLLTEARTYSTLNRVVRYRSRPPSPTSAAADSGRVYLERKWIVKPDDSPGGELLILLTISLALKDPDLLQNEET
jgi:hypothetical protein